MKSIDILQKLSKASWSRTTEKLEGKNQQKLPGNSRVSSVESISDDFPPVKRFVVHIVCQWNRKIKGVSLILLA